MKDHSSSSSTDSRSAPPPAPPPPATSAAGAGPPGVGGSPCRGQAQPHLPAPPSGRRLAHSDSESSCSGNECHPVGRGNPPPRAGEAGGPHMDRGGAGTAGQEVSLGLAGRRVGLGSWEEEGGVSGRWRAVPCPPHPFRPQPSPGTTWHPARSRKERWQPWTVRGRPAS